MELLKKQLLTALTRKDYTPLSSRNLARSIGVPENEFPAFQEALEQLRRDKQVVIDSKQNVNLPAMGHRVIGTFRANERGFGFIIPLQANAYGDLFVSPADTAGAMNNDIVAARAVKKGHRDGQMRYSGIITDIIERSGDRFVGTLKREQRLWQVQPESKGFYRPILIDDATASGAKEGDKVVLEIVSYPSETMPARGAIVEVLGEAGQYDTEIRSIMTRYNLPDDFPDPCRQQARQATEN
ncbi:MAG: hypothetical protein H8E62_00065, partial [Planctomycetes bacterium]|nr:hypothetical protein [Planctomycetota bacterium]